MNRQCVTLAPMISARTSRNIKTPPPPLACVAIRAARVYWAIIRPRIRSQSSPRLSQPVSVHSPTTGRRITRWRMRPTRPTSPQISTSIRLCSPCLRRHCVLPDVSRHGPLVRLSSKPSKITFDFTDYYTHIRTDANTHTLSHTSVHTPSFSFTHRQTTQRTSSTIFSPRHDFLLSVYGAIRDALLWRTTSLTHGPNPRSSLQSHKIPNFDGLQSVKTHFLINSLNQSTYYIYCQFKKSHTWPIYIYKKWPRFWQDKNFCVHIEKMGGNWLHKCD